MTKRVNGQIKNGVWFTSNDQVRFLKITATGATFEADLNAANARGAPESPEYALSGGALLGVESNLEKVVQFLQTRGTIVALEPASETVLDVCMDYGTAVNTPDAVPGAGSHGQAPLSEFAVIAELVAFINGLDDLSAASVQVGKFAVAV